MRVGMLCCVAATISLLGCVSDGGGDEGDDGLMTSGPEPDAGTRRCVDEDDDGFGTGCSGSQLDCDDADPLVTDECIRCMEPAEDCPCEPGTVSMLCIPEAKRVTMNGVSGKLVCSEGARYCRDGVWSDCEFLALYTSFVPD
jgi:hypothetical protein